MHQAGVLTGGSLTPKYMGALADKSESEPTDLTFYIFSKHLQFLDYGAMADAAAEIGFDGIDLTVRPKGHVLPERATQDLPNAIQAIKKADLLGDMMATGVNNSEDPINREVLETASELGVKLYRLSYLNFDDDKTIPESIQSHNKQLMKLAALNRKLGITGAYQNHSGTRLGAAIWDIHLVLKNIPSNEIGCQYDIRHGVVEGGASWQNGLKLIKPNINCIVLKDFVWAKSDGRWRIKNVPLGTGMVDFPKYFKMLKEMKVKVPVTMHYEYSLEGVEHGEKHLPAAKHKVVFDAMKRDLKKAKEMWDAAEAEN